MHSIQHALREIAGPATLTSDQLESLAMQFVCSAMPSETLILVSDLMQRSKTIVRILLSVVSRCPEGQRDAAHDQRHVHLPGFRQRH